MTVDPQRLLALQMPDHECAWTQRDCQLYALATGFGQDPVDERELRYVLEGPGFVVSPTAAITLYYDDRWMRESGVNLAMSLHGEQRNVFHRPIPPEGRARVSSRITGIFDKGPGRGLVVVCEQVLRDAASGEPIATNVITNFARADGGIGFSSGPAPQPHALPNRPPDASVMGHYPPGTGAAVPALRGPQPAPRGSRNRESRRFSATHPAWHVQLRVCGTGSPAGCLRLRRGTLEEHWRADQRAGLSGRRTAHGGLAG